MNEYRYWENAVMLTLTYDDYNLPIDESLHKEDLQLFNKRLRKELGDRKIKYYCTGEYGEEFGRPHYHGIYFGLYKKDKKLLEKVWNKGFVHVNPFKETTVNYVTAYITKKLWGEKAKSIYGDRQEPFNLMSKGIGLGWLEEFGECIIKDEGLKRGGRFVKAPRYYYKRLERCYGKEFIDEMKNRKVIENIERKIKERDEQGIEVLEEWKHEKDLRNQVRMNLEFWKNARKSSKL